MIYQEKIFTKEECELIISYSKVYKEINNNFNDNVKIVNNRLSSKYGDVSYDVFVIKNDETTQWFFDKLLNWFSLKTGITLNKNEKAKGCTLHCYKVGDKFPKHIDLISGFDDRRYNLGIQLNDDYNGGEYICLDEFENKLFISKEIGTALAYYCTVPHEICEITKGERWSIVFPLTKNLIIEKTNLI